MRVTIFGATGLLGRALVHEWLEDEVTPLGSRDADIRSAGQVQSAIARHRPEWIVLAAAYTDVDGCESHRDLAFEVNCADERLHAFANLKGHVHFGILIDNPGRDLHVRKAGVPVISLQVRGAGVKQIFTEFTA